MATLQAVVDIQDRASAKFDRIMRSANSLAASLERVSDKITEIERKLIILSRQDIRIRVSLDTMLFDAQYASVRARMAALGILDGGVGGVGGGRGGFAAAGDIIDPAMSAPGVTRSVEEPILERLERRRVRFNRLDNGFIGFLTVIGTVMRNLLASTGPIRSAFEQIFGLLGVKLIGALQKFMTVGEGTANTIMMVSRGAAVAASSIAGLTAASVVLVLVGTALASIIGILAGVIASLAVPIAGIATGITALVGAIGFVFIPMFKWITDTKELIDQEEQLEERLERQTKGTKEYNRTLKELTETREKLRKDGGAFIFKELKSLVDELKAAVFTEENKQNFVDIFDNLIKAVKPLLPLITDLVRQFTFVMGILAQEFSAFTNSPAGKKFFRDLFESALPVVLQLGRGIGQLARLFGALSIAAAPIAEVLLKDFTNWMGKVADNISSPRGMARLQEFFNNMYPVFKELVVLIKDFVVGLARMGERLSPQTLGFLEWLGDFGAKFADWVVRTVEEYGDDLVSVLQTVGNIIAGIWNIATSLYDTFKPVLEIIFDIINAIADIFEMLGNFSSTPFDFILKPFRTLLGILERIKSLIEMIPGMSTAQEATAPKSDDNIIERAGKFAVSRLSLGLLGGASGAVVTQPTMALIGESGPEVVAPLHSARGARKLDYSPSGNSGGISINEVHVHGVQNLDQFVAEIKKQVGAAPRASGAGMTIG